MTARKPVQLSSQALMRILKAGIQEERIKAIKDKHVIKAMWEGRGRRKFLGWPADQKPSDLRLELFKAISAYNLLRNINSEAKAQWGRLKAIYRHAFALASELGADEERSLSIGMFTEHWSALQDMPAASKLASKMCELVEQSGLLKASPQDIAAQTRADYGASDVSALEWLVGITLPAIYEKFFRESAKVYSEGAYLDFAMQVLKEFKIKCSRGTVMKALKLARSGRSRRQRGGQSN